MSCKYNNCKHCGYKSECEIYKENAELRAIAENQQSSNMERYFKNKDLEKENAELKEVHESDKRSLALIAKKGADLELKIKKLEKACDETQELLDKQIEATYKLGEENAKLKEKLLQEREDYWRKGFNYAKCKLTKAKELIKLLLEDLKNRSYEPVKDIERAEQFLKESE